MLLSREKESPGPNSRRLFCGPSLASSVELASSETFALVLNIFLFLVAKISCAMNGNPWHSDDDIFAIFAFVDQWQAPILYLQYTLQTRVGCHTATTARPMTHEHSNLLPGARGGNIL